MITTPLRRLLVAVAVVVSQSAPVAAQAKPAAVTPADIDRLTGAPWKGTLEYLDYTSQKQVTIKSTLAVRRLPAQSDGTTAWSMAVGYTDEPDANSGETATLSADGRTFRGEVVQERSVDAAGTLRIVTEQDGPDDNRPARFRFVYLIAPTTVSIQKLVRFAPTEAFFERHIYRWSR